MDLQRVHQKLKSIKRSFFRKKSSFRDGGLRSKIKGTGLQFKEHQIYVHGDEVRFIDWKILAKTNTPYVKKFEEERNVEIVVVLDTSASMLLGHFEKSKLDAAIELTCLLYLLAKKNSDVVTTIILGEKVRVMSPMSGERGMAKLITELEKQGVLDSEGEVIRERNRLQESSRKEAIQTLDRILRKKKEVVIFSDYSEVLKVSDVESLKKAKNVHCFSLECDLNDEVNRSQSFVFSSGDKKNIMAAKGFRKIPSYIRPLNISEDYFDEFIRSMERSS